MQVDVIIFQLAAFDARALRYWDTRYKGRFLQEDRNLTKTMLCEILADIWEHMAQQSMLWISTDFRESLNKQRTIFFGVNCGIWANGILSFFNIGKYIE